MNTERAHVGWGFLVLWVLGSTLAIVVGLVVGLVVGSAVGSVVGSAVGSVAGSAVGLVVGSVVGGAVTLALESENLILAIMLLAVGWTVALAEYGAIAGAVLVWLLRQPSREA